MGKQKPPLEETISSNVDESKNKGFNVDFLADKIITFGELFDNIKLYEYQREVASYIVKDILYNRGSVFTVEIARQAGKTEVLALIIKAMAILLPRLAEVFPNELGHYRRGFKAGIFAPQKELSRTMYGRVLDRLDSEDAKPFLFDPSINTDLKSRNPIKLSNGSLIQGHSLLAKNLVSFTYDFIVIDEAQAIPDDDFVTEHVYPMGSATNASIVLVGVAGDQEGLFSYNIATNQDRESEFEKYHFEYDYKHVQQFNTRYEKFVEKRRDDVKRGVMNQTSFDRGYLLKWGFSSELFLPKERFTQMLDTSLDYVHTDMNPHSVIIAGLDLGKKNDSTVLTIMKYIDEKYVILKWLQLDRIPYAEQKLKIYDFLSNYNISSILVDSTGVGEAIADEIEAYYELGKIFVDRFIYTDKNKSAGYVLLDELIEKNKIVVPANYAVQQTPEFKRFKRDCTTAHRGYRRNYLTVETPKSKTRTLHDDYLDSLMLAAYCLNEEIQNEEISDISANFWLRD